MNIEEHTPGMPDKNLQAVPAFDLGNIDALLSQVNEAYVSAAPLTKADSMSLLYTAFTPSRRPPLEQYSHFPDFLQREVALHEADFLGRLRDIRDIDLISLERSTTLDEKEPDTITQAITYTIGKIAEEKIAPLEQQAQALESGTSNTYLQTLVLNQQLSTIRTMIDGTSTCLDRRFFDHTEPEISEYFYPLKDRLSSLQRQVGEQRRESRAAALPIDNIKDILENSATNVEGITQAAGRIRQELRQLVLTQFPGNKNQRAILHEALHDAFAVIKEDTALSNEDRFKVLLMELPPRYHGWLRYKNLSKLNENYVGGGVANIALADEIIAHGTLDEAFTLVEGVLDNPSLAQALEYDEVNGEAKKHFLGEIGAIYESRRGIESILASVRGESELMTPAEAMREISHLSSAMNRGDLDEVTAVVEILEGKKIDLYHVTANQYAFDKILDDGELLSTWAGGKYGDTFFGGGIYFWAAQQEDWMKGGDEAIHLEYPVKDLFIIKNKYNNPQKGPFSAQRWRGDDYLDSQKKSNIIAMLPARALQIREHVESPHKPLSNEGYTAQTIEDITQYDVDEVNFIWRIDKHYGNYDTEYFITPEKEADLRKHLGEGVKVERNVFTPGYIGGEYDRLVVPRSISVLKATSLAYTLRIPEVVYEDRLEALHQEEQQHRSDALEYYHEQVDVVGKREDKVEQFIENIRQNQALTEDDRVIAEYFFTQIPDEMVGQYIEELDYLQEILGEDFPTSDSLEKYTPRKEWFVRESTIHGTPHELRVMINMELLARLGQRDMPEGADLNLDALRFATMLHDTRRFKDSASDYKHGQRASEFADTVEGFEGVDRELAKRIMHYHSVDDYEGMTPEELVFKDADALDRFRFSRGPDMRFMRCQFTDRVVNTAYNLAALSQFYLSNGYTRVDAVVKAAAALQILK